MLRSCPSIANSCRRCNEPTTSTTDKQALIHCSSKFGFCWKEENFSLRKEVFNRENRRRAAKNYIVSLSLILNVLLAISLFQLDGFHLNTVGSCVQGKVMAFKGDDPESVNKNWACSCLWTRGYVLHVHSKSRQD